MTRAVTARRAQLRDEGAESVIVSVERARACQGSSRHSKTRRAPEGEVDGGRLGWLGGDVWEGKRADS